MKYPVVIKKINTVIAFVCGVMVFAIALLTVFEAVMRSVFQNSTSWSLNLCTYLLIWFAFMGSAYSFQAHGHVGVDLLKDWIDGRTKTRMPRRVMAIIGYVLSIIYIFAILYGGVRLCQKAVTYHQTTATVHSIPLILLTSAVVVGCAWMIVTLICIIIDLIGLNDDHL
ncbi:MAG: TRAP transporter small permease subunit [Lachnospiraceae bacterium]|nr:TRAP transporter small permease subunit [Lachnospiraceae bacterium]